MSSINDSSRGRGRPREFDIDEALDRAILHFRKHGYNGVSIADLSGALKLSSGSIYKAFLNKHNLFSAALDRYMALRGAKLLDIINSEESGREKLRRLLVFYAESSHASEGRYGCLVIVGAVELASTDEEIAAKVSSRTRRKSEKRLKDIILQGQNDGSISKKVDAETTARLMLSLAQGMRVLGKTGQKREDMMAVVDAAMQLLN
ncbi:TetR/AcrR family transcriptional regulator [Halomonas sp. PA16-9]|uniref:TetR/AcrR family transcriptional regulator n=1 Tax=Halomonas sp. PA16-9 TaxID=2576841 RepID=UPI0012DA28A8|nr:TetR/AcrR family transcriptional regulator [Halomonas sp. PA16-9]